MKGDFIGIAATSFDFFAGEDATVEAYDKGTGVVTLKDKLRYYHWGAAASTADKYSGVDMRGEVVILTRDFVITAENKDTWGCQVLTADVVESNGDERQGMAELDSIQIHNCS